MSLFLKLCIKFRVNKVKKVTWPECKENLNSRIKGNQVSKMKVFIHIFRMMTGGNKVALLSYDAIFWLNFNQELIRGLRREYAILRSINKVALLSYDAIFWFNFNQGLIRGLRGDYAILRSI